MYLAADHGYMHHQASFSDFTRAVGPLERVQSKKSVISFRLVTFSLSLVGAWCCALGLVLVEMLLLDLSVSKAIECLPHGPGSCWQKSTPKVKPVGLV